MVSCSIAVAACTPRRFSLLWLAILAGACQTPPPVVGTEPAAAEPTRPPAVVIDEPDGNDSFTTAVPLLLDDETGAVETFQVPDDLDTFVVEVPDERVVQVRVVGNITGWMGPLDAELALRDEAGTLLAENNTDQLQAFVNGDPRAVVLFGPGRLYVEVSEAQGVGDGSSGYTVLAETVTRGLELEPNDTREQATDLADFLDFSGFGDNDREHIGVSVTGTGDSDWFRLPVATADTRFYLTLSRRMASAPSASFSVHDATGAVVARSVPWDREDSSARASLWPAGTELWVQVTSDAAPQAVVLRAVPSQRLTEHEPHGVIGQNDELATAEELPGNFPVIFLSDLSATGDVDRFQVAEAGDYSIACGSKVHGSGVLGFTLEVVDGSDAPLEDPQVEDDSGDPVNVRVNPAVPFQFRFSKQGQDTENLGGTFNCTLFRFN